MYNYVHVHVLVHVGPNMRNAYSLANTIFECTLEK